MYIPPIIRPIGAGQEVVAPDDLPKTRSTDALSEEEAMLNEQIRALQDRLGELLGSPPRKELLQTQDQIELDQANMEDALARATALLAATHQHEFTYALNNNHTALRGCACGLAFVGLMAAPSTSQLVWHQIHED